MEPGPVSDLTQHFATRAPDLCSCWPSVVLAIGKNGQDAEGCCCRTCWQALSRIVPSDCSEMSRRTHERAVSHSTACRTTPCDAKGACPCAATNERVSLSGHCIERCPLHARSCFSCLYRTCNCSLCTRAQHSSLTSHQPACSPSVCSSHTLVYQPHVGG